MSGGFLKIGALSNASNIQNVSDFILPASCVAMGNLKNAFNFKNGNLLDYYSANSRLVGNPSIQDGYLKFGDNAYIQTDTSELLDFVEVVAFKPLVDLTSGGLLIGNIEVDSDTLATVNNGWGIAQNRNYYVNGSNLSAYLVTSSAFTVGNWAIVAMSRSASGRYAHAIRSNGNTVISQGTGHSTIVSNSQKIGIGSNSSWSKRGLANHSVIAFAAVHAVTKDQTQLQTYVNALATELNAIDPTLIF